MVGQSLDDLLGTSLRESIEDNLGREILNKIEQRLMERHGVGLVQSIQNFHTLDSVLREFFGAGAEGLEHKLLQNLVNVENTKQSVSKWVQIQDAKLSKVFLESFADQDKNSIIASVMDKPLTISDILKKSNIPQTSGYRKINFLINSGLLVPNGFELVHDRKKVTKYETIFENVKMDIDKKSIIVKIQLKKDLLDKSAIFQSILASS